MVVNNILFLPPGPSGGLKLLLNIEKYEHMRGPNMDSGVKVGHPIQ